MFNPWNTLLIPLRYGRSSSPWGLYLSPGGSSGGTAALVAACGSPAGLTADIGGSTRIPALLNGLQLDVTSMVNFWGLLGINWIFILIHTIIHMLDPLSTVFISEVSVWSQNPLEFSKISARSTSWQRVRFGHKPTGGICPNLGTHLDEFHGVPGTYNNLDLLGPWPVRWKWLVSQATCNGIIWTP